MRDDALARAMFIESATDEVQRIREDIWNADVATRSVWLRKADRVRRILDISPPLPERSHPLPGDVVQCPFCGSQRLGSASVDCGDDDSVSLDDVIGIFSAPEPRELVCMICHRDYPVWFAPNDLWNAVVRLPDGSDRWPFLCPTCFALKAVESGADGRFCLSVVD